MDLVSLVKVTFSQEVDEDKQQTTEPLQTIAKVIEPKITSKNWYDANLGKTLSNIILVKGDFLRFRDFNTVEYLLDGISCKYTIFSKTRENKYTLRLEVGL